MVCIMRSVASMMEDAEDKALIKMTVDNMVIDDNCEMEGNPGKKRVLNDYEEMKIGSESRFKKGDRIQCCNKSDGKGWHCKNEPKEGHSMCDHHLNLLSGKKHDKSITGARRGRAKAGKRGSSSGSNPYEFYYYSGFGPLWGKRRGDRGEGNKSEGKDAGNGSCIAAAAAAVASPQNTTPSSTSSPIERNEKFDYVDEDDDEEDTNENGDSGKKRMRKPVKARSLKSLM